MVGFFIWAIIAFYVIEIKTGGIFAALQTAGVIAAGIIAVGVGGLAVGYGLRHHALAEYAVTDDRLMAFSGVFGRDYSTVEWANVRDLEVTVDKLDKPFGTGHV